MIEEGHERETIVDSSPDLLWQKILSRLDEMRKENDLVKIFPVYFRGEYLFGLTEPIIIRLIESLPGVELLTNYAFKFGRLQLLDMPLAINPTGCARTEPKLRTHFRKSHTLMTNNQPSSRASSSNTSSDQAVSNEDHLDDDDEHIGKNVDEANPFSYTKQFVQSKSSLFKKLKSEWRQNVYLAKSQIQGLGLYAARDLEKGTMIIEYIGDLIRNEVANRREKLYQEQVFFSKFYSSFYLKALQRLSLKSGNSVPKFDLILTLRN